MNHFKKIASLLGSGTVRIFMVAMVAVGVWAQDTTVTSIQPGTSSFEIQVKNAEVVYVSGNDLVLKLENGKVEHLVVPDSDKFNIDGKEVGVRELVPGTRLTQTIGTSTTPHYVKTVRTIEGRVWHVNIPRSVILTLPDHTNQIFNVPKDVKFIVDGQDKTVFDLKKGMKLKATIVTDDAYTVVERTKFAFGQAPPVTPPVVGVLLFVPPTLPQATVASAEPAPQEVLPQTGTMLPLAGLLGTLAIALSMGLGAVRRSSAHRA